MTVVIILLVLVVVVCVSGLQELGTGYQRAAKTSRIVLSGSNPLCYASWHNTVSAQDAETTNFESYIGGSQNESFKESLHGPVQSDLRFGGDWDAHLAPFGTPPGFYVRDDLEDLSFYPSRIDGTFFTYPWVGIRSSAVGAQMPNGKVTFDCTGFNEGQFFLPTASV